MGYSKLSIGINDILKGFYPDNSQPGVLFVLHDGKKIISNHSIGKPCLEKNSIFSLETKFNIASVSKQFTAIAVLILEKRGELSLGDTIQKWFPENSNNNISNITLEQLLSHSSGIPDMRDRDNLNFAITATDIESYSYIFSLEKLKYVPGQGYEYQNPTYQLFYTIIERASGISFCDFMKSEIFDILNMLDTHYFDKDVEIYNCANAYAYSEELNTFQLHQYGSELFFATKADGGIYTTARDFITWKDSLQNGCLRDLYIRAIQPRVLVDDMPHKNTMYGLGWFIENNPYVGQKVCHYGDNGGFQIYEATLKNKLSYLIFSNRNDKNRDMIVEQIDKKIASCLL